jgi:hypothetical protein
MLIAVEINDVYLKLDSIFKLKLKAQIKGSGLVFERFLHVTNMVGNSSYYAVVLNQKVIHFTSIVEFYNGLIKIIDSELVEVQSKINDYEYHMRNDLSYDEVFLHNQLEELSVQAYKFEKIKEKIAKITNTNPK